MGLTTDPHDPRLTHGSDDTPVPQAETYLILSKEERASGFVRPVRRSYLHETCGTATRMGVALAETYAKDFRFYGSTYCVTCKKHRPVGEDGEFRWLEANGSLGPKVGT